MKTTEDESEIPETKYKSKLFDVIDYDNGAFTSSKEDESNVIEDDLVCANVWFFWIENI